MGGGTTLKLEKAVLRNGIVKERVLVTDFKHMGVIGNLFINYVAVEVLGVSTRVGHRRCTRAFLHVGHTRSLRGR